MNKLKIVGIFVSLAAMSAGIALWAQSRADEDPAGPVVKSEPAPSWVLQDVDGKTVDSGDFKGKVVILDFWATWCPPCRAEIPGFVELQQQYGRQGLAVVGVSLDGGGAGRVKEFVQKSGVNYTVVLAGMKVAQAFGGVEAIPTTFIIDRDGRIAGRHVGFTSREEFEKEIKPLLER